MSIIPRSKGALGFAQYLPNEDIPETREDMVDMICSILGGRVSEQVFFGKVTTGAYDDLQKVRKIARAMIMEYGLSERLGLMSYKTTNSYGVHRHSDATAKVDSFS